jgi:hypothetical protein
MSWADVSMKIKVRNPALSPQTVNGVNALSYGAPPPGNPSGAPLNPVAFQPADTFAILAALELLYAGSKTARDLLDAGTAAGDIWIFNTTGHGSSAFRNTRTVGIDLDQATTLEWMARDGHVSTETLQSNVIHELIHAIDARIALGGMPARARWMWRTTS